MSGLGSVKLVVFRLFLLFLARDVETRFIASPYPKPGILSRLPTQIRNHSLFQQKQTPRGFRKSSDDAQRINDWKKILKKEDLFFYRVSIPKPAGELIPK
jgi:hypothetical protein